MQKKTVFILQDTNEMCNELTSYFNNDNAFEVIGSSFEADLGVQEVLRLKPDFLITEIVLSGYDGIKVLDVIVSSGISTKVIVLSALCREEIILKAINHGAKYFFAKPFNFSVLKERMTELDKDSFEKEGAVYSGEVQQKNSLDEKISKIFINVGIPPHIKGYSFLREGVKMAVEDPRIINNITKKLYPMIGEKYQTSASKVERAIRHAIEVAWNRGRIESINGILGVRAYVGKEKPTNGEFIALVADKMLLDGERII